MVTRDRVRLLQRFLRQGEPPQWTRGDYQLQRMTQEPAIRQAIAARAALRKLKTEALGDWAVALGSMTGPLVSRLHRVLTSEDIEVEREELERHEFGVSTEKALHEFQARNKLPVTVEVDDTMLEIFLPADEGGEESHGTLTLSRSVDVDCYAVA